MATVDATLLAASRVGRPMRLDVPLGADGRPPRALVLRFRIGGDPFRRAWVLSRELGGRAVYRHLGDSSPSFPGARDAEVEALGRNACDITRLVEPEPARRSA